MWLWKTAAQYSVGQRKELEPECDYSSTQRASLLRSHLSCGIKQRPSAASPLNKKLRSRTRASCLLLFLFWSLSKGTFLVRWLLCNQWIVSQWQELTIKFKSTAATHKATGLMTLPAVFPKNKTQRFPNWTGVNMLPLLVRKVFFYSIIGGFLATWGQRNKLYTQHPHVTAEELANRVCLYIQQMWNNICIHQELFFFAPSNVSQTLPLLLALVWSPSHSWPKYLTA